MLHQRKLGLFVSIQFLEFFDEGLSHRNEGLFGPGQEPIDRALVEQGREFSEPISELLADGGEAEADVEVISDPVHEVVVELARRRVGALELLHIVSAGITQEGFLFVLCQQTRNLTGGEDHVDELKELLLLDF
jgi:hypothetical protein